MQNFKSLRCVVLLLGDPENEKENENENMKICRTLIPPPPRLREAGFKKRIGIALDSELYIEEVLNPVKYKGKSKIADAFIEAFNRNPSYKIVTNVETMQLVQDGSWVHVTDSDTWSMMETYYCDIAYLVDENYPMEPLTMYLNKKYRNISRLTFQKVSLFFRLVQVLYETQKDLKVQLFAYARCWHTAQ